MCEQAGYCLTALTFDQLNKSTALASDIMDPLILLLRSNKPLAVKMAAASALSELHVLRSVFYPHSSTHLCLAFPAVSMTNGIRFEDGSNACKKAAIDAGAVGALVPLLQVSLLNLTTNSARLPYSGLTHVMFFARADSRHTFSLRSRHRRDWRTSGPGPCLTRPRL